MTSFDKITLASVLAISAALLAGCERHDGVRICGDGDGRRLPDGNCQGAGSGGHGGRWTYVRSGYAPAVGGAITGGVRAPETGVRYGAAPAGGISRGGFGGTGDGIGGEGGHGGGE